MTGRELIIYILANDLEDDPIYKDGKFIGFITVAEAAEKMNVGVNTIYMWIAQGRLKNICLGDRYLIAADCELAAV